LLPAPFAAGLRVPPARELLLLLERDALAVVFVVRPFAALGFFTVFVVAI
jgi:hypothetical protein